MKIKLDLAKRLVYKYSQEHNKLIKED